MLFKNINTRTVLTCGFPKVLQDDVLAVLRVIPHKAYVDHDISDTISTYTLGNNDIKFPYRVYFYEPAIKDIYSLTKRQKAILHCVYSRSHDGYIREKHITALLLTDFHEWAIPYIVKVCDEYIIDILHVVYSNLKDKNTELIKKFCANNYESFCKSYNRMISYWNEFYRDDCYRFENYIGRKLFIECFGAKRKMNFSK